jgi:hypothetical protein
LPVDKRVYGEHPATNIDIGLAEREIVALVDK